MQKENPSYFQNALSDFTYDVACGGAVRHLADLGYTVNQIMERLDFPVPYEQVQRTVKERLCETGVLLLKEPDDSIPEEKKFVREYDRYGRTSFRQIVVKGKAAEGIRWKERVYQPNSGKELFHFLGEKIEENGEEQSYISCDFGCDVKKMKDDLTVLDQRQREYIEGILWEKKRMYHRLVLRMREIAVRLYENGKCDIECYFKKTKEHIFIPKKCKKITTDIY